MEFSNFWFSYWWLVFPLAMFIAAGWSSWMKLQRHKATLDLLKSYAASGNEPPAHLIAALEQSAESSESEDDTHYGRRGGGGAFLVILFTGLAAVFAYSGYSGMIDLGDEGYFVALIMGVLAVAFLGNAIFKKRS